MRGQGRTRLGAVPGHVPGGEAAVNAALGHAGILLGFAAAVAGIVTLGAGLARRRPAALRQGQTYTVLVLAGAVTATAAMVHAFLTHDFSLAYVAENNSRQTPLLYDVTGMWSALQGSILLWGLILAGYLTAMSFRFRRKAADPVVAWATLAGLAVAAFFFALMLGPADPFGRFAGPIPSNGAGPNPLLQDNALVAIHPVFLYLGFVGFTVPFAFAAAALLTGRLDEDWLTITRRWTLFAWGCLSVGIVLGMWWSYEVLGWGGFWAWDPVENASLLPWLTATAYLHSVVVQERRGLLRVWNLSLLLSTFSLTIFGTFLTRSGVLQSVHSFSVSSIGPLFLGLFVAVVLGGVVLIAWRGSRLRSFGGIDHPASREGAFLVNNLAFAAFAFVVLLGTVFPLVLEAVNGQQATVGSPYFDTMTFPIVVVLLFLMGLAPLLPWRKASSQVLGKRLVGPAWTAALVVTVCLAAGIRATIPLVVFALGGFAAASALRQLALGLRSARRQGQPLRSGLLGRTNGGMVVHLGIVAIAVAMAASLSFGHRGQVTLAVGHSARFDGHTITYLGTSDITRPNRTAMEALVRVDQAPRILHPAVSQYAPDTLGVSTPAISSTLVDDVYLTFVSPPQRPGGPATIGVIVQPLIAWLWIGAGVVALGTLLAAWPRRRAPVTAPVASTGPKAMADEPAPSQQAAGTPSAPRPTHDHDQQVAHRRRRARETLRWALPATVLVGGLVFSSIPRPGPETVAERTAQIASIVRCPSCPDVSVADSTIPSAVAVDHYIRRAVEKGQSEQQILDFLVSRYGPRILLRPPTSGDDVLVWVLPLAGTAIAGGGLALFFFRRARRYAAPLSDADRLLVERALSKADRPLEVRSAPDAPAPVPAEEPTR